MSTRSRAKKQTEDPKEAAENALVPFEQASIGITRNADLMTELKKQREDYAILSQRLAASEERAYNYDYWIVSWHLIHMPHSGFNTHIHTRT